MAQCLELDLAAQGKTEADAIYELHRLLIGQLAASLVEGREPYAGVQPAPDEYFELWERGQKAHREDDVDATDFGVGSYGAIRPPRVDVRHAHP